jgi:hypothetical protein
VSAPPVAEAPEPPPPTPAPPEAFRPPAASLDTDTGPVAEEPALEEDLGEEQVEEEEVETPLSWADVVNSCLSLAEGKGALLINPEGRVIAVSGEWPAPGADAIAARLVPAMDKALKDAPTRSVSVPLGGLHLTAWRAPLAGGLVTIGFVAETPLRPELRPAIDATLRQGPQ